MKKICFLAIIFLPILGFSQIEKPILPKLELPEKIINFDYKKFIITQSPAPWKMPIAKSSNPDLYKILVVKPKENLEKILIAKPNK